MVYYRKNKYQVNYRKEILNVTLEGKLGKISQNKDNKKKIRSI